MTERSFACTDDHIRRHRRLRRAVSEARQAYQGADRPLANYQLREICAEMIRHVLVDDRRCAAYLAGEMLPIQVS